MKVLITTDTYEPAVNGVVSSIKTLAAELRSRGHEVRVLAPADKSYREGDVYYVMGIPLQSLYPDTRLALPKLLPCMLMDEIVEWKPDIIHSQTEFSSYLIARKLARRTGAPLVSTVHTYYEDYTQYFAPTDELGKMVLKRFMHLVLHDAAAIIVPSMKIASVLERYGLNRAVFCIPTGIPLAKFQAPGLKEEAAALRKRLGLQPDDCLFMSLGRVGQEKNPQLLLEAFKEASDKGLRSRLMFVGDGPALSELKELTASYQLDDAVIFAGRVQPDKVAAYYYAANIFVSASNSETQGLTYLEALCSGTPLLVKRDLCLAGVLREGINGYGFESAQECAEYMLKLSKRPDLIGHLSISARLSGSEHSAQQFGVAIESLYETVLERASLGEKEFLGGRLIGLEMSARDAATEFHDLRDQVLSTVKQGISQSKYLSANLLEKALLEYLGENADEDEKSGEQGGGDVGF